MAILFADGFDHYATAQLPLKWDVVGGFNPSNNTVNQTGGRNGKGAYAVGQGTLTKTFPVHTDLIVGFAINMPSGNSGTILEFRNTGGNDLLGVTWNSDNTIKLWNLNSGEVLGTTSASYTQGNWYYFEVKVQIGTSTAADSCVMRINGTVVITAATGTNTTWGGTSNINAITIGSISGALNGFGVTMDDIIILDLTGSVNNDFIGDVIIEAIYPTAQGNYSNFTSVGAGSNYGAVNEHPPDGDTSYVHGNSPFIRDSYTFGAVGQAVLAVKAIQPIVDIRKEGTGIRAVAPFYRQGGINYDQTSQAQGLGDSYGMLRFISEINPATGLAFTASEITAIEAGIKVTL